jgi:hemin uptake protein HemP
MNEPLSMRFYLNKMSPNYVFQEGRAMNQPNSSSVPQPAAEASAVVLEARRLLQGRREIVIEHDGTRYRLRLTRRNKLILQK